MRKANIEPVTVVDKTADKLGAKVSYDLINDCQVTWTLFGETELYTGTWKAPEDVLATWGTDDKVLVQALADAKGFTITSWIEPAGPAGPTGGTE